MVRRPCPSERISAKAAESQFTKAIGPVRHTPLGHGLLTVPLAATEGLRSNKRETCGRACGHGQETMPQRVRQRRGKPVPAVNRSGTATTLRHTPLGHGLLTVPLAATEGLRSNKRETSGRACGHGQETMPERGETMPERVCLLLPGR
jgi:hypothetical protein